MNYGIQFQRNLLKMSSALALSAALAACGISAKKADLAAGANPQAELQRLDAEITQAKEKQYDVLSPKHYKAAVNLRDKAKDKIADNKPSSDIVEDIALGLGHTHEMNVVAQKNQAAMQPLLEARTAAINAKAHELVAKDFRDVDEDFADIGASMEKGNYSLDAKEVAGLETRYMDTELKATKAAHLGEAKALLEKAEGDSARRTAPKTYQMALAQFAAADSAIEATRRNPEAYKAQVERAQLETKKLNDILALQKQNSINEDAALRMWEQQQTIVGQQRAIDNSQASMTQMQETMTQTQAEKMRLEQTSQQMAQKQDLVKKIEDFKQQFGPAEAEVLQDGNRYIVRLKDMQFAPNRAELRSQSLETLKKVSGLIGMVPAEKIVVEGHTDSTGSAQLNQKLSEQRASTVKEYFVNEGVIDSGKIASEGHGFEKPITTNKTKQGRATNRRVDVVIELDATTL